MINRYIDEFMAAFKFDGLTFDDVSLVTQYADFLPDEAQISSKFSRNVKLNIPFASAAMDTVTESKMAIAMALLGGIGVIHKNLSAKRQAYEVKKVKFYLNGLIKTPIMFNENQTVEEILDEKKHRNFSFSGFPILNDNGDLVGLISAYDIKFLPNHKAKVGDVMTKQLITAPTATTLHQAYDIMKQNKVGKLPVITDTGKIAGLYSFLDVKTLIENEEPDYNRDAEHQLRVAAAIGPYDEERIEELAEAGVDVMVVDTAHGDSKGVVDTVKSIKKQYGDKIDVVAGNVATAEAARTLSDAGADGIKVGIGPGSICTTRVVAGVGVPQITAVHQVSRAAASDIPIIADGGIKQSGDVAKAIAAGASSVMMGSALAGTSESTGEVTLHNGRRFVIYRGMGSLEAMKHGKGSRERYGQSDVDNSKKLVPQGIEGLVPFRGPVIDVMLQYIGGLKYSLGYCGARTIEQFQNSAKFIRVTAAGLREAHPHDITMLKDAPNYSGNN
jgi:IMP dehydrogenase